MKDIFGVVSEAKIREAIMKGELNNLSGAGKPVNIVDLSFLPPELRAAFIILKNSGYLDQGSDEKNSTETLFENNEINELNSDLGTRVEPKEKVFKYNVILESRRRRF